MLKGTQNAESLACVFFQKEFRGCSRREEWGLGITVTFSVARECVGMAWLMQIIIAGESQLLWSSRPPRGPFSVEWNALQNSLCILLAAFCISSMLIHPVWVLIAQSMGPSRASEPSSARMSFCSTKQGGRASRRSGWITFSSVCLLPLFKTKPFYFGPFFSVSVLERLHNEKVGLRGCDVRDSMAFLCNRTNSDWSDLCYLWFCFPIQIWYKTREAEITHDNAAPLACTKTTDQAESPVRGPRAPSKGLILYLSEDLCLFSCLNLWTLPLSSLDWNYSPLFMFILCLVHSVSFCADINICHILSVISVKASDSKC